MASIFGYSLGVIGNGGGYNPNSTENNPNPSDFVLGADILTFMNVENGTVLKNKSGDTWTFNNVIKSNIVVSYSNTFVMNGITRNYSSQLFLGIDYNAASSITFLRGSYMFITHGENGNLLTGHPTRVDDQYRFLAPNDNAGGFVEYIDGIPHWDSTDIGTNVWKAFAVFCAREITFGPEDTDPYKPGGNTEPGGGGGDFDDTSIPIDFPSLPTISASDTGFISLFNPTMAQLQELSSYMWSDLFDVEGWKKIFANPMDAILGLSIVPVSVPGGGSRPVKVGNISTGVNLTIASTQYVAVDCGAINVNEYWGAYLDYDPYTKAEIYLPYIGTHAISVDDIMGKSVHVVYHVDILSGACCAYIKCGESVLYSFVGQCSCSIPITGSDWTNVINGALSIAGAIGSMVATGGASAPMAVGTMASAAVNSLKPNVEKSGSMGGMGGMMGIQVPYLILTRPRQALPSNQNHYTGYPSFITSKLGDCQGYTEIESVHLEGIAATQAEISEIETLLKSGVIF